MSFRLANWQSLSLAVLTLGALPVAQAQSAESGKQIVFSTPEGQIESNTVAPVVQAPEPEELELPDEMPAAFAFNAPSPQAAPPAPLPMIVPQEGIQNSRDQDLMDPMDERKIMSVLTPAQIMGAPTVQQIFGIPDSTAVKIFKNPASTENAGSTNIDSASEAPSDDPTWAKILAGNADETGSAAAKTEKSQGLLGGFFNGPPADDIFGNQDKGADANAFASTSANGTAAGQSPFDSSLLGTTPANSSPNSPTPNAAAISGLTPPSPFALPQSSGLATLPQLPTLPTAPGQNLYTPAPSVPSWEPKPAPWLSPVPPPGTMQPRKF